jgi:hypothetical protein
MSITLTGCLLGLWLGARHALDPDHLAALSTLVADERRPRTAALLGTVWGLGHTLALFAVGALLLGLRTEMSSSTAAAAELAVAAMLVLLGARNIARALSARGRGHAGRHRHGGLEHSHGGPVDHVHVGGWTLARRPLLIGLVHGLAGSGGLTALAMAGMPTPGSALLFVAIFGAGSIAGMALISGLAGLSMDRLLRGERAQTILIGSTGALSLIVGIVWGWPMAAQLFG